MVIKGILKHIIHFSSVEFSKRGKLRKDIAEECLFPSVTSFFVWLGSSCCCCYFVVGFLLLFWFGFGLFWRGFGWLVHFI